MTISKKQFISPANLPQKSVGVHEIPIHPPDSIQWGRGLNDVSKHLDIFVRHVLRVTQRPAPEPLDWMNAEEIADALKLPSVSILAAGRVQMDGAPWGGFSPDSRWLITLNPGDGHFLLWDLSSAEPSGVPVGRWEVPSGPQLKLTITQEPPRLVVNSPRGQLAETWVYDLDFADPAHPKLSEPVRRPGRWVYARRAARALELSDQRLARVYDVSEDEPRLITELRPASGERGDISEDGRLVACLHGNLEVHLHRELEGKWSSPESLLHQANITTIQFAPTGHQLCVTGYDCFLHLWDVTQSPTQELYHAPFASRVNRLTISPDGRFVGVAGWDGQTVYDLASTPPRRIEEITNPGKVDGDWTFNAGPALAAFPGREVWDLSNSPAKPVSRALSHFAYQFAQDRQELLGVHSDQQGTRFEWQSWTFSDRHLFQLSSLSRTWSIPERQVPLRNVLQTRSRVLTADSDSGAIRIYGIGASGPASHEYADLRNNGPRQQISPSGQLVASWPPSSASEGTLWDLSSEPPLKFPITGGYRWIAFLPEEQYFLTAVPAGDGVGLFDWRLNREIRKWQFPGIVDRVEMYPDGKHFLTVNRNGTVYVVRISD